MKTNCNIIYDLLPLYIDGVCSEESKALVGDHLVECPNCSQRYEAMNQHLTNDVFNTINEGHKYDSEEEQRKVRDYEAKKVIKRITRKWKITVIMVMLLIPIGILSFNQYNNEGLSFTNMYDYYRIDRMMTALEKERYEKVFSYIDVKFYYDDIHKRMKESKTATISKEQFQLVVEEQRSYYTNGEINIPEAEFDNWIIEAQKEIIRIKEWYEQSPYVDMSYDEFYSISKANFLKQMNSWNELGISINAINMRFSDSNRDDDITQYNYNISISDEKGVKEVGGITLFGDHHGKFYLGGGFHEAGESPNLSLFFNKFTISE